MHLDMGKYAFYVWAGWGLTVLILGGLVADTLARARRWAREVERLERRGEK
ncbi:MAG: heme exporter protein CcmD [Proteobacteria bacterium]|nr:heme exporter protein CcmD [Pseudomonadota bacterium]